MIQLSPTLTELLNNNSIEVFYMLQIDDYYSGKTDPRLLSTTFYRDITLSNNITYMSDGRLISIAPPRLESIVDKSTFEIVLADPSFEMLGSLDASLIGNLIQVTVGFVNIETNLPLLNVEDTLLIYKGRVDNFAYKINTEEFGESVLIITCGSPMINLDGIRQYHLNKDYVRSQYPDDSCCDQINESSASLAVKWGKI